MWELHVLSIQSCCEPKTAFFKKNLFIFACSWISVAVCGLSLVAASRGYSSCGTRASRCGGFSCCGARASVVVVRGLSSCGSWALERRLSSCGARALLLCGMWDLPRPGLKPASPTLAGGFLTTAPPGKSPKTILKKSILEEGGKHVSLFIIIYLWKENKKLIVFFIWGGWQEGFSLFNFCAFRILNHKLLLSSQKK